ncbi:hypothetical protein R75461_02743 [Paraburkholderia nemoris]|uniref:Uncharacterized protein n=1 Tax=Paraburkholderia nemoris TaxID=2793076 RepID=A0ABN7MXT6_9BURK|nr:hypothetical protein R75461_02743 [Paraburkholderia nemoris]CAE6817242.1 hypothetical protein R75777_05976 [Paraburkholderia nemoris]CAE6826233.1 hypothetical protein R69776_06385 [Paraburkholderia nemoris]CAE6833316.1 hypothetical protein LMG22931_06907 [Paraburkholderia nemoris]
MTDIGKTKMKHVTALQTDFRHNFNEFFRRRYSTLRMA